MKTVNLLGSEEARASPSILETKCYIGLGSFVEGRALQVGIANGGNNYQGVQVGIANETTLGDLVQIGFVNATHSHSRGVQVGFANISDSLSGV